MKRAYHCLHCRKTTPGPDIFNVSTMQKCPDCSSPLVCVKIPQAKWEEKTPEEQEKIYGDLISKPPCVYNSIFAILVAISGIAYPTFEWISTLWYDKYVWVGGYSSLYSSNPSNTLLALCVAAGTILIAFIYNQTFKSKQRRNYRKAKQLALESSSTIPSSNMMQVSAPAVPGPVLSEKAPPSKDETGEDTPPLSVVASPSSASAPPPVLSAQERCRFGFKFEVRNPKRTVSIMGLAIAALLVSVVVLALNLNQFKTACLKNYDAFLNVQKKNDHLAAQLEQTSNELDALESSYRRKSAELEAAKKDFDEYLGNIHLLWYRTAIDICGETRANRLLDAVFDE